jgi:subtilisin family serine protease
MNDFGMRIREQRKQGKDRIMRITPLASNWLNKLNWLDRLNALHTNQETLRRASFGTALIFHAVLGATLFFARVTIAQHTSPPSSGFASDRILVMPKAGVDLTALHAKVGTTVRRSYPAMRGLESVLLPPDMAVEDALALFQLSGLVQYAEPDYIIRALSDPTESLYVNGYLWNLTNGGQLGGMAGADIKARQAWDMITDASSIIVAVTDTGALLTHDDLHVSDTALNLWKNPGEIPGNNLDDDCNGYKDDVYGINAVTTQGTPACSNPISAGDPNTPFDPNFPLAGHGTHIAGIIGAKNNNGASVGVCWKVKIMVCKCLSSSGVGLVSDAIECINYARQNGAKIINASWGDYISGKSCKQGQRDTRPRPLQLDFAVHRY